MSEQAGHEHFRYISGARTVHAVMQDGHNGSILNCAHPACRLAALLAHLKALREDVSDVDVRPVRQAFVPRDWMLNRLDALIRRYEGHE